MKRKSGDKYQQYTRPITGAAPFNDSHAEDECTNFSLETRLQNVVRPALSVVTRGEVLSLQLQAGDTIAVLNKNQEACGYIAHPRAPKLATCIKRGNRFKASVLSITEDVCEVYVEASEE